MKRALIVGLLWPPLLALAAPPDNVVGLTFSQTVYRGTPYDYTAGRLLLTAAGTYVGLVSTVVRQGTATGATTTLAPELSDVSIPPGGTWRYRVIDDSTAELVIDDQAMVLHFDEGKPGGYVGFVPPRPGDFFSSTRFSFDAYDAAARMVNCSTRCYLASGRSVSLGFVIADGPRRVLVRAIGSGLKTFGIAESLENLTLNVRESRFTSLPVDLESRPRPL